MANKREQVLNTRYKDSGGKLIFENATLCAQFLREYSGIDALKNVQADDIEDMTERFIPMFTEERDSDAVKKIRLSENEDIFLVTLIEHKSSVDYNVVMQMFRYMTYIWEDYEKNAEARKKGISKTKDFRYPPILPIVYYEDTAEFRNIEFPEGWLDDISRRAPEDVLRVFQRVIAVYLRELKLPEDEIAGLTDQIKERNMNRLFEHFEGFDLPAAREQAMAEGHAAGHAAGRAAGHAEGLAEGRETYLIEKVCRKMAKGKMPPQIAEELDEEPGKIWQIYDVASNFAPDYDSFKIYQALNRDAVLA